MGWSQIFPGRRCTTRYRQRYQASYITHLQGQYFLLQDTLPAVLGSPSDFGDIISVRRPAFLADTPASPYNRRDTKVEQDLFFYIGLSLLCMTSAASTLFLKRLPFRPVSSRFNYFTTRHFSQSSAKMLITQNKPRIILGCMTFGCVSIVGSYLTSSRLTKTSPDTSTGARITDINDYNKSLDYLQSQGYNEIDTARTYVGGQQEAFTKEAHWQDRGLTLATKCYPHNPGMHKAESITESLNKSLEELGAKCVDIFYLHAAGEILPTLRDCSQY